MNINASVNTLWKVTATVQSKDNPPIESVWQKEGDQIGVMLSVSQLFAHDNNEDAASPWYPELLSIKIEKVSAREPE